MRKRRFEEEQIVRIVKEADSGVPAKELCRKHNISDATSYNWRKKEDCRLTKEIARAMSAPEIFSPAKT